MNTLGISNLKASPFVLFWLGLLTGALIVSLIFAYRYLNSQDYNAALLKGVKTFQTGQSIDPAAGKGIGGPMPPGNSGASNYGIGGPMPPGSR